MKEHTFTKKSELHFGIPIIAVEKKGLVLLACSQEYVLSLCSVSSWHFPIFK
jgi:hypothetical protein